MGKSNRAATNRESVLSSGANNCRPVVVVLLFAAVPLFPCSLASFALIRSRERKNILSIVAISSIYLAVLAWILEFFGTFHLHRVVWHMHNAGTNGHVRSWDYRSAPSSAAIHCNRSRSQSFLCRYKRSLLELSHRLAVDFLVAMWRMKHDVLVVQHKQDCKQP